MYLWRNSYVQGREKGIAVASKVAYSPAHPSYAAQCGDPCSPKNKRTQQGGSLYFSSLLWGTERFRRVRSVCTAAPYPFLRREVPRAAVGRAFASLLRAQKWAPYTLLHRDVNASTAEVAEVPREREVICDAIAVLYRGVGGTFRCKNAPKKRIKGALFTDCFVVDNSFCAVYVVEW